MNVDPLTVLGDLEQHAHELDTLSKDLAKVERLLEPVEQQYEAFRTAYEAGLWDQHVNGGAKFPAEGLRLRMARAAMPPELLGRHVELSNSRVRMMQRISTLKTVVDAKRSILSALKIEMEATR
jgi:hypothetical protein